MTDEASLRLEIVQIGRLLYEKGLIAASDGNISARLNPDRTLITPSGYHKGLLEADQIVVVDEQGQQVDVKASTGGLKPTSELPMHLEAYRQRPDVKAVVHAHPPITVALSIADVDMSQYLLPEVIVFLGRIPTTEYATPSTKENALAIRDLIKHHDGLVLKRHGSLTVGDSPMQAFMRLETMEQQARMLLLLHRLGIDKPHEQKPMAAEDVRKLLKMRRSMGLMRDGETISL